MVQYRGRNVEILLSAPGFNWLGNFFGRNGMMMVASLSLLELMHAFMHLLSLRFSPNSFHSRWSIRSIWIRGPTSAVNFPHDYLSTAFQQLVLVLRLLWHPRSIPHARPGNSQRALMCCFLPDLRPSTLESLAPLCHPLIPYQTCTFISKPHSIIMVCPPQLAIHSISRDDSCIEAEAPLWQQTLGKVQWTCYSWCVIGHRRIFLLSCS